MKCIENSKYFVVNAHVNPFRKHVDGKLIMLPLVFHFTIINTKSTKIKNRYFT